MSDPRAICFYAWLYCNDEEYLKEWSERTALTIEKVIDEACKASDGKVRKVAMESSVAHPVREEPPKDRDEV